MVSSRAWTRFPVARRFDISANMPYNRLLGVILCSCARLLVRITIIPLFSGDYTPDAQWKI